MQRTIAIVGEVVRHIDEEADRTQADGAQLVLQPCGAGTIFHALDDTAKEDRSHLQRVVFNGHRDRAREGACDGFGIGGFDRTQSTSRKIARDACNAKRIGTVWGDGDLDDRINLGRVIGCEPINEGLANLAGRQFDDAVMFI